MFRKNIQNLPLLSYLIVYLLNLLFLFSLGNIGLDSILFSEFKSSLSILFISLFILLVEFKLMVINIYFFSFFTLVLFSSISLLISSKDNTTFILAFDLVLSIEELFFPVFFGIFNIYKK